MLFYSEYWHQGGHAAEFSKIFVMPETDPFGFDNGADYVLARVAKLRDFRRFSASRFGECAGARRRASGFILRSEELHSVSCSEARRNGIT